MFAPTPLRTMVHPGHSASSRYPVRIGLAGSLLGAAAAALGGCGGPSTLALAEDAPDRRQVMVQPPTTLAGDVSLGRAALALGAGDASGLLVHEYWLANRDTSPVRHDGTAIAGAADPALTR